MEFNILMESLLNVFDVDQGVLVAGPVDYDLVDIKDGSQVKVKNSDYAVRNLVCKLETHASTIKSLLEDLKSPSFKLKSESLNTRAMQEVELHLFLLQQHANTYKPMVLSKEDVIYDLMPTIKEYVAKTEGVKDAYKIDFLYYDKHCLPFSLRIEDGKFM